MVNGRMRIEDLFAGSGKKVKVAVYHNAMKRDWVTLRRRYEGMTEFWELISKDIQELDSDSDIQKEPKPS
ncbi:MAG: hypothetical protein WD627_12970 [Actinomycetota bacterium]